MVVDLLEGWFPRRREALFRSAAALLWGVALPACGPAPAPPSTVKPPPSAVSATALLRKPISLDVQEQLVIGFDEKGKEVVHGYFSVEGDTLWFKAVDPTKTFHLPLRRFPGAHGAAKHPLAVSKDGVALVGGDDGSLLAVDYEGNPRFQLGVRWAVLDIQPRPQGGYEVMTVAGPVIVDPTLPAPVEPPPTPPAPLTYRLHPAVGGRAPDIVIGPNEAWAIEVLSNEPYVQKLRRFDGKTWTDVPMRELTKGPKEKANPKKTSELIVTSLERGPKGQLLLVGQQNEVSFERQTSRYWLRVFEWNGRDFKERADLAPAYPKTRHSQGGKVIYSAGPGGREIACFGESCLVHGLPPSFSVAGGKPPASSGAPGWVYFPWRDGTEVQWPDGSESGGGHATIFAGPSLFRIDNTGLTKDGGSLVNLDAVSAKIGKEYKRLPDLYAPLHDEVQNLRSASLSQGLWASGPNDVWASIGYDEKGSVLFRWDGKTATEVPCPLSWVSSIWGSGPDDVWFSGDAVAHYDGHEVHRVPGIPVGRLVGGASGDVWIGAFHVTRAASVLPDLHGTPAGVPPIAPPSIAVDVTRISSSLVLEPLTLPLSGEAPLSMAMQIQQGPGGLLWLHDHARIVEVEGASARVIHQVEKGSPLHCQRCMAPRARGEGAILTSAKSHLVGLRALAAGHLDRGVWLPDLLAVATAPNGDVWTVSAAEDSGVARAFVSTPSGIRNVSGLPMAAYSDIAVRAEGDVWLSGGLTTTHDALRAQPTGEGIFVHFDGQTFARYRGPEGALLSIAPVGPGEAWAVGLSGGIVHVKAGVATAYHLERDGVLQRIALRAVASTGPDDVWIGGDRSTLLHWDGKAITRVDVTGVGLDSALTAVVPPRDKAPGWLAGPQGIWRTRWDKKSGDGQ